MNIDSAGVVPPYAMNVPKLGRPAGQLHAGEGEQRQRILHIRVDEARRLGAHPGLLLRREERRIGESFAPPPRKASRPCCVVDTTN